MAFTALTAVRLLHGVPLFPDNKNQMTFANAEAQMNFFAGKTVKQFNNLTYQRKDRRIAVPENVENLMDINYVMFQNADYGNKWYYGFVTNVEYMNSNSAWVYFDIDAYQTFQFDIQLLTSFVEREHVADDTVGKHTLPEGLETGPYIATTESHSPAGPLNIYIMATESLDQPYWNEPAIVGGFPVPVYWASLGSVDGFTVTALKEIINSYAQAGKMDAIVAVFTAPSNFVSTKEGVRVETWNMASRSLSFTPKNNKMYCYPYCCLVAECMGQGIEMQYELFSGSPTATIRGGFGVNMQVSATPNNYAGEQVNLENMMTLKDWPVCAWVNNYYQNWLAQNKANIAIGTTKAVIKTVGSLVTGSIGGIASSANDIAGLLAEQYTHSIIPDQMVGSANAGDISAVSRMLGFYSYCKSVRPEYGQIIDNYFTMFGYKVNTLKVPETNSRESWNYVKTINISIAGNVPSNYMEQIKSMFNSGVTLWHGDYIGDYGRSNNIV
jgi:hypothetical protein